MRFAFFLSSTSASNDHTPNAIQPLPCTSTSASNTHVINPCAQSQPSVSGIDSQSITDASLPDQFNLDFSDDDSDDVADPLYVPDPSFDESTLSDLFDFSEDIDSNN